ncbi:Uronyl 2-sulfotransferase [Lamellibrachia satsuma]|nr:Uronyl 2-sulfotransferase [Lamellibrachia satsuma]
MPSEAWPTITHGFVRIVLARCPAPLSPRVQIGLLSKIPSRCSNKGKEKLASRNQGEQNLVDCSQGKEYRPLLPWVVVVQALVIVWLGTSQSSSGYWCTEVAVPVFRKTSHGRPLTGVQSPSNPGRIFYNRIPKCGSSSLLDLIRVASRLNNFTFVECATYMKFIIDHMHETRMATHINAVSTPMVFERHLHFVDFKAAGMRPEPVYMNLVRDPVDRLESWYYYRRFQDGHIRHMSNDSRYRTYQECVLGNFSECVDPLGGQAEVGYFKIVPFFCGQEEFCSTPGEAALSQAIQNIKKHYAVVGVVEMYAEFIQTLEVIFPTYFKGITSIYDVLGDTIHEHYMTSNRQRASVQVRQFMASKLKEEYQLYDFIKRRFMRLYNSHRLTQKKKRVIFI